MRKNTKKDQIDAILRTHAPRDAQIALRIPTEVRDWLDEEAKRRGVTLTDLLLAIVEEYRQSLER